MNKGKLIQNGVHLEDHEYKTVKFFLEMGYDVELIPPSRIKALRMPDIILNSLPWEMKAPIGGGKYTIKNIIQNASHQSENIIIDLRRCKMNEEKSINELERYFRLSRRIRRIIVITKSEKKLDFIK